MALRNFDLLVHHEAGVFQDMTASSSAPVDHLTFGTDFSPEVRIAENSSLTAEEFDEHCQLECFGFSSPYVQPQPPPHRGGTQPDPNSQQRSPITQVQSSSPYVCSWEQREIRKICLMRGLKTLELTCNIRMGEKIFGRTCFGRCSRVFFRMLPGVLDLRIAKNQHPELA